MLKMPQKILVTGGGGYVGSELVAELADNGHHVACIDRFSNGANLFEKKYEDKIKIIKSDIRNIDPKILDNVEDPSRGCNRTKEISFCLSVLI